MSGADTLRSDLPAYYDAEDIMQRVQGALGNELDRLEEAARAIAGGMIASGGEDVYRTLALWEMQLKLPVEPAGVDAIDRMSMVLATYRQRNVVFGRDWRDALSRAIGTTNWTHREGPVAFNLTLTVPLYADSYGAAVVQRVAEELTPANLIINVVYGDGFILGPGEVGFTII